MSEIARGRQFDLKTMKATQVSTIGGKAVNILGIPMLIRVHGSGTSGTLPVVAVGRRIYGMSRVLPVNRLTWMRRGDYLSNRFSTAFAPCRRWGK